MLIVSCRVHFETRVGLMREVQAVVSRAGKRNSPHKIIREKEDDNKHWANVGLIGGIWYGGETWALLRSALAQV